MSFSSIIRLVLMLLLGLAILSASGCRSSGSVDCEWDVSLSDTPSVPVPQDKG